MSPTGRLRLRLLAPAVPVAGEPLRDEVFAHYLLAPAMTVVPPLRPRVLLLGLGAGTAARGLLEAFPNAEVVGVELDPEVIRLARVWFDLPADVEVHVPEARGEGARAERRLPGRDLVAVQSDLGTSVEPVAAAPLATNIRKTGAV